MFKYTPKKTSINGKKTKTKHAKSPVVSTSCPVRDLSSPRVDQSTRCPVCESSSTRVGNPRVGVSASCPVTPSTLPCGIPLVTSFQQEKLLLTFTLYFLAAKKSQMQFMIVSSSPYVCNFEISLLRGTLSNALIYGPICCCCCPLILPIRRKVAPQYFTWWNQLMKQ